MCQQQQSIFVLTIGNDSGFAFEAKTLTDAENLLQQAWFDKALDEFISAKHMSWNGDVQSQIRIATPAEARLYREYCAEFAEESNQHHLLARLGPIAI